MKVNIVRLKPLERELARIADCLEALLAHEYRIFIRPPKADKRGDEPEVSYATDEATFRQEVEEWSKGQPEAEEGEP